jgi:hypothetical protein
MNPDLALKPRFFLLFAAVYLYAFPYFGELRSANEMPRILMTQEMVDRGVFFLDRRVSEMGSTLDLSKGPDGRLYPNKAPGPSFLAVPAYLVCKFFGFTSLKACTWAFRVTAVTLPALFFLPFFYRLTRRFAPSEVGRRSALAAYALGSPALIYGILFFSHQLAAVFAGGAFVAAVALVRQEVKRTGCAALLTGFLSAMAVMMDYQAALAVAAIGLYVLWRAPAAARVRAVLLVALGALGPAVALGAYHTVCFGLPWRTGYSFAFDTVTQKGMLGLVGPSARSFWSTLFLPANGLVVLAPWVLLAGAGAVAIARDAEARARVGAEAAVCGVVAVLYVFFLSSLDPYMARGGWCVGPRYLTVALPFFAWLASAGFAAADKRRVTAVLAQGAALASVVVFIVAATTFPHWPDQLRNPLYELAFPLLGKGYAVHSLGTALGLSGPWAVLPLYGLVLAMALFLLNTRPLRTSWRTCTLACVLGAAMVLGHATFPRTGPYAVRAWTFVTSIWET